RDHPRFSFLLGLRGASGAVITDLAVFTKRERPLHGSCLRNCRFFHASLLRTGLSPERHPKSCAVWNSSEPGIPVPSPTNMMTATPNETSLGLIRWTRDGQRSGRANKRRHTPTCVPFQRVHTSAFRPVRIRQ